MNAPTDPIRLTGIHTSFNGEILHRGIDLRVRAHQKLGLVGGSGSGKTTLLRVLLGLFTPDAGTAHLFGREMHALNREDRQEVRNRCGVLFQGGALFTDLSVFDNIALPLRELRMLDADVVEELVCMKLQMVGLAERVGALMPSELSGGMTKRAALARALALEPDLLCLDEPTSGLDPVAGDHFIRLINQLYRDLGFSLIMITHDPHSLGRICDHIAVLADGGLVAHGTLDEVIRSDHEFVRAFFHVERGGHASGQGAG